MSSFFIFGAGYSGQAFAAANRDPGTRIAGTTRSREFGVSLGRQRSS